MDRHINQIPMQSSFRTKLIYHGFDRLSFFDSTPEDLLARDLEISEDEARKLTGRVRQYSADSFLDYFRPITAFELLRREETSWKISTGSFRLNEILGGGVPLGRISEFSGVPGVGKTQFCMQLCVNAQVPQGTNALPGCVVYIDTEGGLVVERLEQIAKLSADQFFAQTLSSQPTQSSNHFDVDAVLKRIFYFRCHDYAELCAVVHLLPDLLKEDLNVKLIVIDSIAAPFRYSFDDMGRRAKILNSLMQHLTTMAVESELAVVLTNQMTTKLTPGEEGRLVPALGTSWGHACGIRVNLFWKNDSRMAFIFKSPTHPEDMAPFTVTTAGIRDLNDEDIPSNQSRDDLNRSFTSEVNGSQDTTMLFMSSQLQSAEEEPENMEDREPPSTEDDTPPELDLSVVGNIKGYDITNQSPLHTGSPA